MSGAFIVQKNKKEDLHEVARLLSSAVQYGGEHVNHYCIQGQSVMGLAGNDKFRKGIMPVYIPSEGLWAVLLGELHESDGLADFRKKNPDIDHDAGVFARLYRSGCLIDALPGLNGAFFIILFDPTDNTIIAANDRYGLYPMYWAHSKAGFCLASRVLCSVLSDIVAGDWDVAGAAQFLTIDDYIGESTLVSGVSAYPQASVLVKKGNILHWHTYWHYDYPGAGEDVNKREAAEELGRRFLSAVRHQTRSAGRIGVTLSGGLDSRCIAAAAAKEGIPLQTFTWGKAHSFDRIFAGQISRLYRTEHHDCDYAYHRIPSCFEESARITEGLINYFDCHMLFHLHILKEHTDLVLNGYAGDLVLGGSYLRSAWLTPMPRERLADMLFRWRNTLVPEDELGKAIPDISSLGKDNCPSGLYRERITRIDSSLSPADTVDRFFLENRVRRSTSMGTVLMREVVESAACFFAYQFLDLTTSISFPYRKEHRIYREMMKCTFPEAMKVRWQRTLLPVYLPSAMDLPAKAFLKACRIMEGSLGWPSLASRQAPVDFSSLLRGILRPWMDSIIGSPHPDSDAILKSDFCERVWERHRAGEDHTRLLGAIASIRGFSHILAQARMKKVYEKARPVQVKPIEANV